MPPLERVLEALQQLGCPPRGSGRQWQARCPAHDDRDPSLSITEGQGRVALVRCHAGCEQEDVVAALGLAFSDLRPVVEPLHQTRPVDDEWVAPGELALYLDAAHDALLSSEAAALARRYLRRRGVTGEHVRRYHLGFGIRHTDQRLDWLHGRVIVGVSSRHVEGRAVPDLACSKPGVRWLSAIGSKKTHGWWRTSHVDPGRPVVLVEGPLDVLALDEVTGANAVAVLGKTNVLPAELRSLRDRGVREALLGLDADATPDQWRAWLLAGRDNGLRLRPVVGPTRGDWGDLLTLPDDERVLAAAEALTLPEVPA